LLHINLLIAICRLKTFYIYKSFYLYK